MSLQLLIPRFSSGTEQEFQANYYARIRPTLRLVAPALVALLLVQMALIVRLPTSYDLAVGLPQLGFWLLVSALMWKPSFERYWQLIFVVLGLLMAALVLGRLAPLLTLEISRMGQSGLRVPTDPQQKFYFLVQFAVLMVSLTALRLQFRWAALLYGGVTVVGIVSFLQGLPPTPDPFRDVRFVFLPVVLIVSVMLLTALVQEQLSRSVFLTNQQLEAERNTEKRQREATQKMLHVLNGAIGGIVHDLGNPLASVQMGAQTLEIFVEDGADKETLRLCTDAITSGAQMLNFLRLSLIEQSRVLEGKPVPVELKSVSVRAIVEAGASFQQPRFSQGHTLSIEGDDLLIRADEMRLVTVLMNLIGNALKYSDGEVCVSWQAQGGMLLLGVLDVGMNGRGLTREQAARLFTSFGRLETHANIEGTGLGLLSVQKVVEAHGGGTFIEGYEDGTPDSPRFSTAHGHYPTLLKEQFRTAFMVTCPLEPQVSSAPASR